MKTRVKDLRKATLLAFAFAVAAASNAIAQRHISGAAQESIILIPRWRQTRTRRLKSLRSSLATRTSRKAVSASGGIVFTSKIRAWAVCYPCLCDSSKTDRGRPSVARYAEVRYRRASRNRRCAKSPANSRNAAKAPSEPIQLDVS